MGENTFGRRSPSARPAAEAAEDGFERFEAGARLVEPRLGLCEQPFPLGERLPPCFAPGEVGRVEVGEGGFDVAEREKKAVVLAEHASMADAEG